VIRLLLVDDHASSRDALAFLLEHQPDMTVVGQAGSLDEARQLLRGVDIAIVDLQLPDGNGTELIRELRAASPEALALILTASANRVEHARAIEGGATAVLHKAARTSEVIDAVRRAAAGEAVHSQQEIVTLLHLAARQRERERLVQDRIGQLTSREREVLQTLADGCSEKEMAERLHISVKTAHNHVVNILAKLDVDSRLQALVVALRYGLVSIAPDPSDGA
jgi:DNA-binding NarL/FixJ family response regulator